MQLLRCTKIKSDVDDEATNMSPLVEVALNADHDGDALYGIVLKEMKAVEQFKAMHPAKTMMSKNAPIISNTVTLMEQTLLMNNNWLMGDPMFQNTNIQARGIIK